MRDVPIVTLAAAVSFGAMTMLPVHAEEKAVSETLLRRLQARSAAKRVVAVKALADIRPLERAVLDGLVGALADSADEVRRAARVTLQQLSSVEGFSETAVDLTRPPRPISMSPPVYPAEAKKRKLEGTVLVEVLIDRNGTVTKTTILTSVPALDDAALECVRGWLFTPAVRDGRLVLTVAHVPVAFQVR